MLRFFSWFQSWSFAAESNIVFFSMYRYSTNPALQTLAVFLEYANLQRLNTAFGMVCFTFQLSGVNGNKQKIR